MNYQNVCTLRLNSMFQQTKLDRKTPHCVRTITNQCVFLFTEEDFGIPCMEVLPEPYRHLKKLQLISCTYLLETNITTILARHYIALLHLSLELSLFLFNMYLYWLAIYKYDTSVHPFPPTLMAICLYVEKVVFIIRD